MFGEMSNDNRILAVALNYSLEEQEKPEERPVIIVSKDVLVRIKADVLGYRAQDYLSDQVVVGIRCLCRLFDAVRSPGRHRRVLYVSLSDDQKYAARLHGFIRMNSLFFGTRWAPPNRRS